MTASAVRELAQALHAKAASLYNHISSVDDVNREVGKLASRKLNERLEEVCGEKRSMKPSTRPSWVCFPENGRM